jgi:hypothetical protein
MASQSVYIQVDQNEAPGAKNDNEAVKLLKNDFAVVKVPLFAAKAEKRKFTFIGVLCFVALCIYLGTQISTFNLHHVSSTSDNLATTPSQEINTAETNQVNGEDSFIFIKIGIDNQKESEILEINVVEVIGNQVNGLYMNIEKQNGPETVEIDLFEIENNLDINVEIIENQKIENYEPDCSDTMEDEQDLVEEDLYATTEQNEDDENQSNDQSDS